jgi:predicted permease
MGNFLQDVKYGIRTLAKSPGLTAAAVLSLALGIGANSTVFTWAQAFLFQPLPGVPEQDRVLSVGTTFRGECCSSIAYADYDEMRRRSATVDLFVFDMEGMSLTHGGQASRAWGLIVSGNYFDALQVRPHAGRFFLPEEDRTPDTHPVVVLGHDFWQRRFGGNLSVVNTTVDINKHPFTIIGIAPPGFKGTQNGLAMDLYVPVMMTNKVKQARIDLKSHGNHWLAAMARLRPGFNIQQAQSDMDRIMADLAREFPDSNENKGTRLDPLWRAQRGATQVLAPILGVLMGVVALVLLIACGNVANLLLARAVGRRREIAIRLSLGASRTRLLRQLLTESLLLALAGGAGGLLLAYWTKNLFMMFVPPTDFPVSVEFQTDWQVLWFTAVVALATGLLFGLAPAWQATRPDVVPALKDESTGAGGARGKSRLRGALVVAQVALSLVLLIAAGLFLRSLNNAQAANPGFRPENLLIAGVDVFPNGYTPERGRIFFRQLVERVSALPGVESASLARRVPLGLGGGTSSNSVKVDGYEPAKDEAPYVVYNVVAPDYFATMGIPVTAGREFTWADEAKSQPVCIISEATARRYFAGRDPLGRRIDFGLTKFEVVGVVGDVPQRFLNEKPRPMAYLPVMQVYRSDAFLHIRSTGDPAALAAAVRGVVHELDPTLPVFEVITMQQNLRGSTVPQQIGGTMLGMFGGLALLLAAVGLYGVIAYIFSQRTHEIGVRVALGAGRRDILRLVLGHGAWLAGIGLGIGLAVSAAVMPLMKSMLLGVEGRDPVTFTATALVLAAVALAASYLPARRAARVDPIVALRYE